MRLRGETEAFLAEEEARSRAPEPVMLQRTNSTERTLSVKWRTKGMRVENGGYSASVLEHCFGDVSGASLCPAVRLVVTHAVLQLHSMVTLWWCYPRSAGGRWCSSPTPTPPSGRWPLASPVYHEILCGRSPEWAQQPRQKALQRPRLAPSKGLV